MYIVYVCFFWCRWNSIGFIKINLGGPNRQVVHHPLEQNSGRLGYRGDDRKTTQLNMDEKISSDKDPCCLLPGFYEMSRLWVLITAHLALLSWVLVHHFRGYFAVTKTPLDLLTFEISYKDHVPIKLVLHTDEIDPDKVVQDICWRCWSLSKIRKISLTEPVEIRRSVRNFLLNTMKNGWLIFRDENGHSLFSGMYLPVQWDVRDVMVFLL